VDVGVEIELVAEGLDDRDHAGPEAPVVRGHGHELGHGLPGGGREGAEELAVVHEVRAEELRDREDPLGVADIRDHHVLQEGGELGGAPGAAGWAEPAPPTREGEQVLGGAVGTADAGEASLEEAAVALPRDHAVEETAPEAIAALEEVLPGALDLVVEGLDERVEGCLGGPARPIEGCFHGTRSWRASCRRAGDSASARGTESSARAGDAGRNRGDRKT